MTDNLGSAKLKEYASRRVRLEEERDALNEDIAAINTEIKGEGYTVRAFNMAVKRLRMTPEKRQEAESVEADFFLYWDSISGGEE